MKLASTATGISLAILVGAPVHAQDWTYTASVYLFSAETEVGLGDRSGTLSFSDALDNLDFAFMGAFTGNNGQWGFLADFMTLDLSFGNSTPGPIFGGLNTDVQVRTFSGYATYRIGDSATVQTDLLAGFRWFDMDTTLTLLPGTSPGSARSAGDDWVDPVIGIRTQFDIAGDWTGTFLADYGGSSDRDTWQVFATANYAFNENWVGRFGYRYLSVENDELTQPFDFSMSGPVFGVSYQF